MSKDQQGDKLDGACETPLDDLERMALEHYEEVSSLAHDWLSTIPQAIRFYFDAKRKAAVPEIGALEALRELVACKDLKDSIDAAIPDKFTGHTGEHYERVAAYQRRKPLAWERARAVVAGTNNAAGQAGRGVATAPSQEGHAAGHAFAASLIKPFNAAWQ